MNKLGYKEFEYDPAAGGLPADMYMRQYQTVIQRRPKAKRKNEFQQRRVTTVTLFGDYTSIHLVESNNYWLFLQQETIKNPLYQGATKHGGEVITNGDNILIGTWAVDRITSAINGKTARVTITMSAGNDKAFTDVPVTDDSSPIFGPAF